MLRSLVIVPNSDSSADAAAEIVSADPDILRRNLTQENLEKCFAEGCNMWIDIVTPEAKEIRWLEGLLQLSPNVVEDSIFALLNGQAARLRQSIGYRLKVANGGFRHIDLALEGHPLPLADRLLAVHLWSQANNRDRHRAPRWLRWSKQPILCHQGRVVSIFNSKSAKIEPTLLSHRF